MDYSYNKKQKIQKDDFSLPFYNPLVKPVESYKNQEEINTYYTEIIEDLYLPGSALIFGKIFNQEKWESICIRIQEIRKEIFFKEDGWNYCEYHVQKLQQDGKIWNVAIKKTTRKLLENNKTISVKCVKVSYISLNKGIHRNFADNFIYSYQEDAVESIIIKLNIKGPCWLKVTKYERIEKKHLSNCKNEISIKNIDSLQILNNYDIAGHINILYLDIKIEKTIITNISWIVSKNTDPLSQINSSDAKAEKIACPDDYKTEKELLNYFLMKMYLIDADLIIGYKLIENLHHIIHRVKILDIKNWSRLGKITRSRFPNSECLKMVMIGRILYEDNRKLYKDVGELSENVINSHVISTSLFISSVIGSKLSDVFTSGKLQKCEYLILNELYKEKYFWINNKTQLLETATKEKYLGGLVLEPEPGLYDYILSMDFNSLYPTIIQEYEICFTDEKILPKIITNLLAQRKNIQNIMEKCSDIKQYNYFDDKQKALKKISNSIYGCFGCEYFRFYNPKIAEKIAFEGRNILEGSKFLVNQYNIDVIYGDTDSIMINPKVNSYKEVAELGEYLKETINFYYKYINISVRDIFCKFLLYQKKNYAGKKLADINEEFEIKGLIRSNNSLFSQNLIEKSLQTLLNYGFAQMENYIKEELNQIKSYDKSYFYLNDSANNLNKNYKKISNSNEIDYKWYINKEVEPFIQRITKILNPYLLDTEMFCWCEKNPQHKIYFIQNNELDIECQECNGFTSHFQKDLTINKTKNIITRCMKEKMNKAYCMRKKSKDFCYRNLRNVAELNNFNTELIKIKSYLSNTIIKENVVTRIYNNSEYFKIHLKDYASIYNYSLVFN